MRVYYNENDKKKCAALSQLMKDGHIRKGDIDDRSIADVQPEDLKDYERCHFFAGIGLWDYALNLARWPENMRVWTGSCPCQPFSTAGRQKGKTDDRHLWPEWERLIAECKAPTIFGEQVANAISKGWLDDVYQGLEAKGYAVGAVVLPACSIGAPHRRDRLWFVAHDKSQRCAETRHDIQRSTKRLTGGRLVVNAAKQGLSDGRSEQSFGQEAQSEFERLCGDGFWGTAEWVNCPDGKERLIEPGIRLLANGYPERVGILISAGDAIVPQVAAEFISSFLETTEMGANQ